MGEGRRSLPRTPGLVHMPVVGVRLADDTPDPGWEPGNSMPMPHRRLLNPGKSDPICPNIYSGAEPQEPMQTSPFSYHSREPSRS
jgi:hypothetical protein